MPSATWGSPLSGRKLVKAPSARSHRQLEHLPAQRGEDDRHPHLRRPLELEAGRGALAVERRPEKVEALGDLARAASRTGSRSSPRRSDPRRSRSRGRSARCEASAMAAACCASSAGPRWKTPTMPVPRRASLVQAALQGQRREAVRPVGLPGPEVGVARRLRPADVLGVLGKGDPGQRKSQSPSLVSHARRTLSPSDSLAAGWTSRDYSGPRWWGCRGAAACRQPLPCPGTGSPRSPAGLATGRLDLRRGQFRLHRLADLPGQPLASSSWPRRRP